ncbi:MAG: M36 family metallopeptidase [Verrucomicrobiia bacterium]
MGVSNSNAFRAPDHEQIPNFDKRLFQKGLGADDSQIKIANQLAQSRKIKVKFDPILGTVRWMINSDGYLNTISSNPNSNNEKASTMLVLPDQIQVIKKFIDDNKTLFGHGSEIFESMVVQNDYVTAHNGVRTIIYQQIYQGLRIFNARFIVHIDKSTRIAAVSSLCIPSFQAIIQNGKIGFLASNQIPPQQALMLSANNIGCKIAGQPVLKQNNNNKFTYQANGLRGDSTVELIWFPLNKKTLRLAYEVFLISGLNGEGFRIIVDANTGEILYRQSLTRYIGEATYRVFTNESPTPMSPGFSYPNTNQPPVVERVLVTLSALDTNASPIGWIYTNLNQTTGNNVDAYLDRNADDQPDLPRVTGNPSLVFDFALDLSQSPYSYSPASVVNLFYWANFAHDKFYELGFTEETGNFQYDNFGKSGFGNDPLKAEAQDGDGYNNSNMTTPPDGSSPRMQMFIFTGPTPYRDGSLDAEVIIHEYTHGVSDRLVGGGPGLGTLQALGMGEGWSDFFALAMTGEPTDDIGGNYPMGAYIAYLFNNIRENYYFGIRRYPYSTNMNANPLTFKDIDPTQASPHSGIPRNPHIGGAADEVHNIGEVWCAVLWDMRAFLIEKYGYNQGNFIAMRLVIDGMKYSPPNPNFLEARDAILLSDRLTYGGANRNEIWKAFARRGMGFFAISPESDSSTGIVEDFNMPDDLSVTPTSGFVASGQIGGPFTPAEFNLVLTNTGITPLNWRASCDGILELSIYSGTLTPAGESVMMKVSLNSAVVLLPQGIYYGSVYITNLNTGIIQTRQIKFLIGQKDFFVEMYDSYDNDLDFMSITFIPDSSPSFYRACREVVTNFYTDPAGGYVVTLDDDSRVQIVLPYNMEVEIYGIRTNAIWIGANGDVSFAKGDTRYFYPQLSAFYEYPRVAPLYVDLNPATGGTVSWKPMPDGVAVTWQNVPEYGKANRNSFQTELFTNGIIRMTWLSIETLGGMAGLSAGGGVPPGLTESDFTAYPYCGGVFKVFLPASATEGDGVISNGGLITINVAQTNDITINLTSTDNLKLIVPSSIVMPAGRTSVTFDITVVDNQFIDGTQYPQVIATATGFTPGYASIAIYDNETNMINISAPSRVSEDSKKISLSVQLLNPSQRPVALQLTTSDANIIQLPDPPLVFIPAGQTNIVFNANIVGDDYINGSRTVFIQANMQNWNTAPAVITVDDDESTNLTLVLPQQIAEGSGLVQSGGWIYLDGMLTSNLVVHIYSDNTNKVQVPQTVIISSNEMEAAFDLFIPDNTLLDGSQIVTIIASAPGFVSSTAQVVVIDNEMPIAPYSPQPIDRATNVSLNPTLKWLTGLGEQVFNGGFEYGSFEGWKTEDEGVGGWMLSNGRLQPGIYGELPKYSGNFSAWTVQYGPGRHTLYQDIFIPDIITAANLKWTHSLINKSGVYNSNQFFKVSIFNQSNQLLRLLYCTDSNTPSRIEWTEYTADLSQFRGKTVRISFTEQDESGNLFAGIDNVSLILQSSIIPGYEVYLATSNLQFQLISRTTNNFISISNLTQSTIYYWRVLATYESAQISSPVWQFTTRSSNSPPSISITAPSPFAIFPTPGRILLQCDATDEDGSISNVIYYVNDIEIARTSIQPYQVYWSNSFPGKYRITATAIDNDGAAGYSSPVEVMVGIGGQTVLNFIVKGSIWRYLDDGSNQGSAWRGYYFDDSAWNQGYAPLGYGFNDTATILNFGPDYNNKFITYYFRSQFTNTYQLSSLILKLRRDDGAIVYINGYEVLRDNMPSGAISYTTLATSPVIGDDQFKYYTYSISNVLMVSGKNVISAEVHQSSPDSADLIFDLELSAIGNYPPTIQLRYPTNDSVLPYRRPLTIIADAYDRYGEIAKVEFYVNSEKIGEATNMPYQFTITDPPTGYLSISARAIDNLGAAISTPTAIVRVLPVAISNYQIQQSNLAIEWSTNFPAVRLETTTNLFSGIWTTLTNQTVYTNDVFRVILPRNYQQQYFRLILE